MRPLHIIISGGSSVGKSTLIQACLKKFENDERWQPYHFVQIHEVARDLLPGLGLTGEDLQRYLDQGDNEAFANVQQQLIHEQILRFDEGQHNNYLSDRSGFDALAYIHHYLNDQEQTDRIFETEEFQQMIRQCQHSLIFIILPQRELQVVKDNVRIYTDYEDQLGYTRSLQYCYGKAGLHFSIISDLDLTERLEFIEQHIHDYIHTT